MKKIAIVMFVVSAALAGCHSKKADTTPPATGDTAGSATEAGSDMGSGSDTGTEAGSADGAGGDTGGGDAGSGAEGGGM